MVQRLKIVFKNVPYLHGTSLYSAKLTSLAYTWLWASLSHISPSLKLETRLKVLGLTIYHPVYLNTIHQLLWSIWQFFSMPCNHPQDSSFQVLSKGYVVHIFKSGIRSNVRNYRSIMIQSSTEKCLRSLFWTII